ncbi:hypothetical protein QQ045_023580 [Rhodiola kirilowii]
MEVEGAAIWLGMKLASRKRLSRVEVIQKLLRYAAACGNKGKWIGECCNLLEAYKDWKMEHVLRDINSAADHLAHKAREESWEWSYMEAVPRSLSFYVVKDMSLAELL